MRHRASEATGRWDLTPHRSGLLRSKQRVACTITIAMRRVEVERLARKKPPAPSQNIAEWIVVSADPARSPEVLTSLRQVVAPRARRFQRQTPNGRSSIKPRGFRRDSSHVRHAGDRLSWRPYRFFGHPPAPAALSAAVRWASLLYKFTAPRCARGARSYHLLIMDRASSYARSRGPVTTLLAPSMPPG